MEDKNKDKKAIYRDGDGKTVIDPRYIPDLRIEITYTNKPFTVLSHKITN